MWFTAACLIVSMSAVPVFAAKTTPATDKNTNVPAVPRAIPDLVPYHKFDPPAAAVYDPSKLVISGDMRVRPEYRKQCNLREQWFEWQEQSVFHPTVDSLGVPLHSFSRRRVFLATAGFQ